jgi:hypothetical protein
VHMRWANVYLARTSRVGRTSVADDSALRTQFTVAK